MHAYIVTNIIVNYQFSDDSKYIAKLKSTNLNLTKLKQKNLTLINANCKTWKWSVEGLKTIRGKLEWDSLKHAHAFVIIAK